MDEHLVFLEPETGDTEHMRIRDGGGVFAPYGFDAGDKGVDGGGFRLKGKSVVQSDRDAFLKRLFLTDTDTSDSSSGGAGSVNFPKMRNGERPYLAVKEDTEHGAKRDELHIYVGESSSDQLEVRAGGGLLLNHTRLEVQATACDAPVPTPANPDPPCRNPANTPLFAIYDAKQKDDGWEEDAQKHVFTPYMAGLGGAHVNDDKEKILIGNQPQWADAVYLWGKADFDNGQLDYGPNLRGTHRWYNSNDWHGYTYVYVRNDTGNHSTWSYGYKETYCREDEAHHCSSNLRVDYNRCWWSGNCNWDDMEATNTVSVVAAPSPPGTDGDGHNTHSLRLRSYADGIKDNATGNSWGQAYTYQFWRLYWDPSDFPAGAIVAKAGFWMRQREEIAFQPGRTGNGGTQVYMWGMEDDQYIRGGGAQGNNDWIYYQYNWNQGEGVHDYDWQEVLIKGDLLYQGNNVYLQSYNYGQYMAITQDLYIDTIEFSFLTANLSEMQVFADTKHWGSLHVLGELKVAGRKSFVQQHPTDPSKEINYVAMEGGESGTYWRGTARLKDGVAVVQLPEHFSLVTAHEGLTATVTLREPGPAIYASEVTNRRLVVRTADRSRADVTFDFIVLGVRKGFEDHVPVRHRQPRQLQRTAADGTPVTSVSFH